MRGNAAAHLIEGWSRAEALGRWTDGGRCALTLPPIAYHGRMQVVLAGHPLYRPPAISRQRVLIRANGMVLDAAELPFGRAGNDIVLVRDIAPGILSDKAANRLDFLLPDATSLPNDSRQLGLFLRYLVLEAKHWNRQHSLGAERVATLDREHRRHLDRHKQLSADMEKARRAGEIERALELCEEAARAFPNWGEPNQLKSALLHEVLRPAEAMAAIDRAIAADPANDEIWMARATSAVRCQQYECAVSDLRKVTARTPASKWPWVMLANAFNDLDWLDCAAGAARRLHSLGLTEPNWIREVTQIDNACQTSRAELRNYLRRRKPRRFGVHEVLALAGALCRNGWPRMAIRFLARRPDACSSAQAYGIAANGARRGQSLSQAIEIAAIPARLGISDPEHDRFHARLLYQAGRYEEAARVYESLAEQTNPDPAVLDMLCSSLLMARDLAQIEQVYRRWDSLQPGVLPSRWMLTALVASGRQPVIRGLAEEAQQVSRDVEIPRVIFQYWDSPDIPAEVARLMHGWAEQNQDFEHIVFDQAAARQFLQSNFPPAVIDAFELCRHPAMQADLLRLAFLAANGGVYVDADEQCRMPLARLFSVLDGHRFVASLYESIPVYTNNWFLAAAPGNDIIQSALDASVELIHADRAAGIQTAIWTGTGPGRLTQSVVDHVLAAGSSSVALISTSCWLRIGGSVDDLAYKSGEGDWRRS